MDQICMVVPIRELEACRNADYRASEQRIGIFKEAWYLASWRLERSDRARLPAAHGRSRAHAPRLRD